MATPQTEETPQSPPQICPKLIIRRPTPYPRPSMHNFGQYPSSDEGSESGDEVQEQGGENEVRRGMSKFWPIFYVLNLMRKAHISGKKLNIF